MKIIIADDHVLFRETLKEYIERNDPNAIVSFSDDFYGVIDILEKDPEQDLALLDLRMPGMEKMQGFKKMQSDFPKVKTALMSGLAEANEVRAAVEAGIVGYFPKTMNSKDLMSGIAKVIEGEKFIPVDQNTNTVMKSYASDEKEIASVPSIGHSTTGMQDSQSAYVTSSDIMLTDREGDVVVHLIQGQSNKTIARELKIQEVTVKLHIRNICQKLNVVNRTQAALKARELGFGAKKADG